jgi:hypothetical protein
MRLVLHLVARVCGVPHRNFITLETYVSMLEDEGFTNIRTIVLPPSSVFLGFSSFVSNHDRRLGFSGEADDSLSPEVKDGWDHIKQAAGMLGKMADFADYVMIAADQEMK